MFKDFKHLQQTILKQHGKEVIIIPLEFRPVFAWITVEPAFLYHCGEVEENKVHYSLEKHKHELHLHCNIRSEDALIHYCVIGLSKNKDGDVLWI